jgi:hypothetical protein
MMVPLLLTLLVQPPENCSQQVPEELARWALAAYEDALLRLRVATFEASEQPTPAHFAELEDALAAMDAFDHRLRDDEGSRELVLTARIILAGGLSRLDPPDEARVAAALDEVFRTSAPELALVAIAELEPELLGAAEARHAALAEPEARHVARVEPEARHAALAEPETAHSEPSEPATITVVCHGECVVTVTSPDDPSVSQSTRLSPGEDASPQMLVLGGQPSGPARSPDAQPGARGPAKLADASASASPVSAGEVGADPGVESSTVPGPDTTSDEGQPEQDAASTSSTPASASGSPAETTPALANRFEPPRKRVRLLPRWAEITGLSVGAVVLATGAGLWSTDGRCPDPRQELHECPQIWEATPAGAITVSVGAALLVTSTVLLVVDEKRVRRRNEERRVVLQANGVLRF